MMMMMMMMKSTPHLRMKNGERVDPDPPSAVFELDGVVEEHAEERHDHLGDVLFVVVPRVDVRH